MMNKNTLKYILKGGIVAFALLVGAQAANAQITTASTTPGMPTTGNGGNTVMNLTLLTSSLAMIGFGGYALRQNKFVLRG